MLYAFISLVSFLFGWYLNFKNELRKADSKAKKITKIAQQKIAIDNNAIEIQKRALESKEILVTGYIKQLANIYLKDADTNFNEENFLKNKEPLIQKLSDNYELYLKEKEAFRSGLFKGRDWLANFFEDAFNYKANSLKEILETKKRPSIKASEEITKIKNESASWISRAKFLEYQLISYKNAYPFLEEYEELILNDTTDEDLNRDEESFLKNDYRNKKNNSEWNHCSNEEKTDWLLKNYINKNHSKSAIGKFYERQIGYTLEVQNYDVNYFGAKEGFKDMGRDVIAENEDSVIVIQAKCWSSKSIIHEKHIFNLYATTIHYKIESNDRFHAKCTTQFHQSVPVDFM